MEEKPKNWNKPHVWNYSVVNTNHDNFAFQLRYNDGKANCHPEHPHEKFNDFWFT
jgi:hypothetical protein